MHIRLLRRSTLFMRAATIMLQPRQLLQLLQASVQRFLRRCFPRQFHCSGAQFLTPCGQRREIRRFVFLYSTAGSALFLLFGQDSARLLSFCIQGSQTRILFQTPFRRSDLHCQSLATFIFPPGLFIVLPATDLHRFQPCNFQLCFV